MPTFSFPSFSYSSFIIVFSFCSSSYRHSTPYWHRVHSDFMQFLLLIIVHVLLHEMCASAHDKLLRSLVGYLLTKVVRDPVNQRFAPPIAIRTLPRSVWGVYILFQYVFCFPHLLLFLFLVCFVLFLVTRIKIKILPCAPSLF